MKYLWIVSSPVNTECTAMLCIVSISLVAIFCSGLSFSFAGPITRGNFARFKDVLFSNGSRIPCQEIGEENRCPPGTEIDEECDSSHGPMKCVPCKDGYYQCDYITSDVNIKCYQSECPEQGKEETTVKVTTNEDGTCKLECACNEAMGYSGHPMDCTLQKTLCGINSELKNGSCVGCDEGFHNPDKEFGRCVPKPSAPTSSTSSFKIMVTMETTGTPVINATTGTHTTSKPHGETEEQTSPGQDSPPDEDPSRPVTGTESSDNDNTIPGLWVIVFVAVVVFVAFVGIASFVLKGKNNIACCSGQVTQNRYSQVETAQPTQNGIHSNGQCVRQSRNNSQENLEMTSNQHSEDPPSVPNGAAISNGVSVSIPSHQSSDQDQELPQELNIAVIYAKDDQDLTDEIKQRVDEVVLDGGKKAKAWDFNHPKFGPSKVDFPHQFTSVCQLTLIVLTCNTSNDAECKYMIEEAVALTRLVEGSTYCVRPLHTEASGNRTYSIPSGLAGVEDFDWTLPGFEDKLKVLLNLILQQILQES